MSEDGRVDLDGGRLDAENPWPGLAPFGEGDRDFFFGREADSAELARLVLRTRLTILFGLSGLGKTSLIQAGLFPVLRGESVLPIYVRLDHSGSGGSLRHQVKTAIAAQAGMAGAEAPPAVRGETLWEYFHRPEAQFWSPRNRPLTPLLVIDQFEELFTVGRSGPERAAESGRLLTELAELVEGRPPTAVKTRLEAAPELAAGFRFNHHDYKILLGMREDLLPELEGLRKEIPSIGQGRLRLRPMNGEQALSAITRAGGHLFEERAHAAVGSHPTAGGTISSGYVAERVVRFVGGARDESPFAGGTLAELQVEPALLSLVCRELNQRRRERGESRMTLRLLEGSRAAILDDFYERSTADVGPEVRAFVEDRLLTASGYRESLALESALAMQGVTRAALDRLVDRRLLRLEVRGGLPRVEVTHDVLCGVIRSSRDSRRQREEREREEAERREQQERDRRARLEAEAREHEARERELQAAAARDQLRKMLAHADLQEAFRLADGDASRALAHLARALIYYSVKLLRQAAILRRRQPGVA